MAKAALVRNDIIAEIFPMNKAALSEAKLYHPDFVAGLIDLPNNAVVGKYWINGEMLDRLPPTTWDVQLERDSRSANFTFQGNEYQLSGSSVENILGAGTLALGAIVNGAQPGDFRWADPNEDFKWITNNNDYVTMDAQTTFQFAQAAAAWRKKHIYAARALKDMDPIPLDYASNNSYWGTD